MAISNRASRILSAVTGSNKGIGLALVEKLALFSGSSGEWDIYLTARNTELRKKACEDLKTKGLVVKFYQLDITDPDSRKQFLQFLKANYANGINIAVNNAGIAYRRESTVPLKEQARLTIATNFTATVDFTLEFLPHLAKDARVVQVSSKFTHTVLSKLSSELYSKFTSDMQLDELRKLMSDFVKHDGEHEKFGWPRTTYGASKLGLTKACYILGDSIKNDTRHIVMNSCCPGYVATDMTKHEGSKTAEEGADTLCYLATLPLGVTEPINKFVSERRVVPFSKNCDIK